MIRNISRRVTAGLMAFAIVVTQAAVAMPAHATNKGTKTGDTSIGCSVNWNARSILAPSLPDDLMTDLEGNPVNGGVFNGNGGYLIETTPAIDANSKGRLEVQHWLVDIDTNGVIDAGDVAYIRIVGGTMHNLYNFSFTPSLQAGLNWSSVTDTNAWAAGYFKAVGQPYVTPHTGGNVLLANHAVGYTYSATVTEEMSEIVASANIKGTFLMGQGCESIVPPAPTVENVGICQLATYGRTQWKIGDKDITVREKYDQSGNLIPGTSTTFEAEINSDGWVGGDAWESATSRIMRLYAGSRVALDNVTLAWTPTQGFDFTGAPSTVITGSASGMGALYGNGFTAAVPGTLTPILNADGSISLTIPHMPANSGLAFSIGAQADGSLATFSMNSTMKGGRVNCDPIPGQGGTGETPAAATPDKKPIMMLPNTSSMMGQSLTVVLATFIVGAGIYVMSHFVKMRTLNKKI